MTWLVMACPSFTSPLWKCLTHPGPWALPQALMGIGGTSPAPTLLPTLRKAPGKPSRSARKHKSRREVRTAGGRADEAGVAGAPHGGLQLGLTWGRGLLGGDRELGNGGFWANQGGQSIWSRGAVGARCRDGVQRIWGAEESMSQGRLPPGGSCL